jgi:hypothetical protein
MNRVKPDEIPIHHFKARGVEELTMSTLNKDQRYDRKALRMTVTLLEISEIVQIRRINYEAYRNGNVDRGFRNVHLECCAGLRTV